MANNDNLHAAKKAKNDEFYTMLTDIEKELWHYKDQFENKTVFLNCDDPKESEFWFFFSAQFDNYKLKRLIATHYDSTKPTYMLEKIRKEDGTVEQNKKGERRMSRNEITYIEKGERLIGLNKEDMRNVRLWMLLDVWRFDTDFVAEHEDEKVKFDSFEDFANYFMDDLDGMFDDDEVYEYVRSLCNTEIGEDGYEYITYVRGHRPVELNCNPLYYDFDEGDCFSYNNGAWYYKVLKAAHHVKGNTLVSTRTYRSNMTVYTESGTREAYKFDNCKFLGNNVF